MRKLATIRTIAEINPIPNADMIEVAVVDGWECVVAKKDNFQVGDSVVYIEIDSIVPDRPEFEFLRDRKFRVRTIKLRKQVSQGLVLPLGILPSSHYKLGDDVTEVLGVTKYDPELEQEMKIANGKKLNPIVKFFMRFNWFRKLYNKFTGNKIRRREFPSWIVKTDEERIQNLPKMFELEKEAKTVFVATEKLDGTSATFALRNGEFTVCSRNVKLDENDSYYWRIARDYDIKKVITSLKTYLKAEAIVLQGEIIGEGIQGNKYKLKGLDFFAYNLIVNGKKVSQKTMEELLTPLNIKCVTVVYPNLVLEGDLTDAPKLAKGKSLLNPSQKREGIVVRNYEKELSFKIINPDFLLEEK